MSLNNVTKKEIKIIDAEAKLNQVQIDYKKVNEHMQKHLDEVNQMWDEIGQMIVSHKLPTGPATGPFGLFSKPSLFKDLNNSQIQEKIVRFCDEQGKKAFRIGTDINFLEHRTDKRIARIEELSKKNNRTEVEENALKILVEYVKIDIHRLEYLKAYREKIITGLRNIKNNFSKCYIENNGTKSTSNISANASIQTALHMASSESSFVSDKLDYTDFACRFLESFIVVNSPHPGLSNFDNICKVIGNNETRR